MSAPSEHRVPVLHLPQQATIRHRLPWRDLPSSTDDQRTDGDGKQRHLPSSPSAVAIQPASAATASRPISSIRSRSDGQRPAIRRLRRRTAGANTISSPRSLHRPSQATRAATRSSCQPPPEDPPIHRPTTNLHCPLRPALRQQHPAQAAPPDAPPPLHPSTTRPAASISSHMLQPPDGSNRIPRPSTLQQTRSLQTQEISSRTFAANH
ncbi:hypothetical protein ACLOJK_007533 [Asimina triloba]